MIKDEGEENQLPHSYLLWPRSVPQMRTGIIFPHLMRVVVGKLTYFNASYCRTVPQTLNRLILQNSVIRHAGVKVSLKQRIITAVEMEVTMRLMSTGKALLSKCSCSTPYGKLIRRSCSTP